LGGGRNQLSIEEKIMAFKELSRTELEELLSGERIVRIGFEAKGERYLVPLGFISHRGALYAMTRHGRKTRMAALNPKVSFQIDTSATTGPFSWHSKDDLCDLYVSALDRQPYLLDVSLPSIPFGLDLHAGIGGLERLLAHHKPLVSSSGAAHSPQ
jgi:hypothetical protein